MGVELRRHTTSQKREQLTRKRPLMACSTTEIATAMYLKESILMRKLNWRHMVRGEQVNHYIGDRGKSHRS